MSAQPSLAPRPALFLDRDGVLNVDRGYVSDPKNFEWIPGAIETVRAFNARNWWVFVVTNQSGIGMGLYTEEQMRNLHAWMLSELRTHSAVIDRIYHCPYREDATIDAFRKDSFDHKPNPGMLLQAMTDFPVIKEESFLIGDRQTDLDAAQAAGVAGFLFKDANLSTFSEWALSDVEANR